MMKGITFIITFITIKCVLSSSIPIKNYSINNEKLTGLHEGLELATIKGLNITNANSEILFDTTQKVDGICLTLSEIFFFPNGFERTHSNLQAISIRNVSLKEIRQENLKHFSELIYLEIYKNDIKFIERNLFDFNLKLQILILSYNQIQFIHLDSFKKLKNLHNLNLLNNACFDVNYSILESTQDAILNPEPLPVCASIYALYELSAQNSEINKNFDKIQERLNLNSKHIFYSHHLFLILIILFTFFISISIYLQCRKPFTPLKNCESIMIYTKPSFDTQVSRNVYEIRERPNLESSYSIPMDEVIRDEAIYSELNEQSFDRNSMNESRDET